MVEEAQGRRMGLLEIEMTLLGGGLWIVLSPAFVGFDLNYFTGFSLNVRTERWKGRGSHFITFLLYRGFAFLLLVILFPSPF